LAKFINLKRVGFHIIFWLAYLVQDTWLAYLWMGPALSSLNDISRVGRAFELCATLVLPKILFTYFVVYFVLPRIYGQRSSKLIAVGSFLAGLTLLLFTVRSIELFFVYPVLWGGMIKASKFWSPFGFLFAFIDIGYINGIAIAIKLIRTQFTSKEKERALMKEKLEAEIMFLRNQTNPHFLFNTLNNIYGLALKKSDQTAAVVMKLSKLLRFMIYETQSAFIRVGDEMGMLDSYIELERIRYTKKVCISFVKEIDDECQPIGPLLLLPFVENAFKHGVSENRFASYITMHAKLRGGYFDFCIENSKECSNCDRIKESVGLTNVRRQLELLYHDYTLNVQNGTDSFKVSLKINLNDHASL
jgi:two-component system, LytTR family, sensor kinase